MIKRTLDDFKRSKFSPHYFYIKASAHYLKLTEVRTNIAIFQL